MLFFGKADNRLITDNNDADFVVLKIGVCDVRLRIPVVVESSCMMIDMSKRFT